LDEIGDMDLTIQPRLLKVLDEKRFRRLGQVRDKNVDVRLIAASHQDLSRLVQEQKFRSDLFFRVNTIPLVIPPLRERKEDIPVLAEWFLNFLRADLKKMDLRFDDGVVDLLTRYHWPGNIRELRNVLERAALQSDKSLIRTQDIHFQLIQPKHTPEAKVIGSNLTLEEISRQHIDAVLKQENGNVDRAAVRLGLPRSTLYVKIKQYSLTRVS
jgi:transcriptional regulator with PAS, ATPase and Fis domain